MLTERPHDPDVLCKVAYIQLLMGDVAAANNTIQQVCCRCRVVHVRGYICTHACTCCSCHYSCTLYNIIYNVFVTPTPTHTHDPQANTALESTTEATTSPSSGDIVSPAAARDARIQIHLNKALVLFATNDVQGMMMLRILLSCWMFILYCCLFCCIIIYCIFLFFYFFIVVLLFAVP